MSLTKERFLLFIFWCILTRVIFVIIAKYINVKYLPILGYLALIPALGFIYIYLTNSRKIGIETGGEKIWWGNLRPIHAIFYLLFSYNAINKNPNSWIYLLIDVTFGLFSFLIFHFF